MNISSILYDDETIILSHIVSQLTKGSVTCHDFGCGRAAGVPGPQPIHILGEVKNIPIHILPIAKIVPIHTLFFSNFTHSYTFGDEKIPH